MKILVVATIAAVMLHGYVACGGDFTIARRGAPVDCTVVVSEKASPSVRCAAQELCGCVKRMTGVALKQAIDAEPISGKAVLIGQTRWSGELADNGLGEAVNGVLNDAAQSETGEKIRGVGEKVGTVSETAGGAIQNTMDAARDGAVGNAIDSALDTAASGAVGDAMNDTIRTARIEIAKAIAQRTAAYVHLILLCVLWMGLIVALTIIKNTFGIAFNFPVIKQADRLGGAALGVIECAIVFWILAWVDKVTGFGWLSQIARGTVFLRLFV